MALLDGKVAIVTAAGRGLGRSHALALAGAGARVVVNDLGATLTGEGADATPAQSVVDEILAVGAEAVADGESVADFEGARRAGGARRRHVRPSRHPRQQRRDFRDRILVNMEEAESDAVIEVHLKGTSRRRGTPPRTGATERRRGTRSARG